MFRTRLLRFLAASAIATSACISTASPAVSPPPSSLPASAAGASPTATLEVTPAPTPTPTPTPEPPRNPAAFVDGATYAPVLDPADFVAVIDNPYFPLSPGTTWVFEGGTERIEVEVTAETRRIIGIDAVVVHDRVWDAGELIEDTFDWYAQDRWGNVWYLGEATTAYDGGTVSHEGSWQAGVDGAQPGIVMLGEPRVGDVYRQEFYAGHAEDMARIVRVDGAATVAAGTYEPVLVTEDWSPLEPDVVEEKTYALGIGFIFERFVQGGEGTVELVEVRSGG